MSVGYAIAAFSGISEGEVAAASTRAEMALRDARLVEGSNSPDCIVGDGANLVLCPAKSVADLCPCMERALRHEPNGVAFHGPRYVNFHALGSPMWFECPACEKRIGREDADFAVQLDALGWAAAEFSTTGMNNPIECVRCQTSSPARSWLVEDPVFLADLALEFWNWAPLENAVGRVEARGNAATWSIDIPALLQDAVGQPTLVSWVRV